MRAAQAVLGRTPHVLIADPTPEQLAEWECAVADQGHFVVPRQRLLEEVWGYDPFATTNTIEVFVSNLRRKLEAGGASRVVHTVRGRGYRLAMAP